jgi:hypothetical protein
MAVTNNVEDISDVVSRFAALATIHEPKGGHA